MSDFAKEYQHLNKAQRQAVDHIDGPVLVIAGPGTGKTQLLSARVANILQQTDTLPQNILCLTFTESGAANMRQRLTRFIGQAAYSVNISTYHAFGDELIRRFPEYFAETRLQNPVDDLGKYQVLQTIVDGLSYTNPLKQVRHHLGDLIGTVSEVKRALLSADDLRAIAAENAQFIKDTSRETSRIFETFTTMPRKVENAAPFFEQSLQSIQRFAPKKQASPYSSLAALAASELATALDEASRTSKTTPLTKWKNTWLAKNEHNEFIVAGDLQNRRIAALAGVFESYEAALQKHGWYDFDDMILNAIKALGENDAFRFTLQEQYLYVLLDEFQDTNAAQLKLIQLLTDNPVNEGRPNVMAVGDDDQAIYAFQGAQYSNMLDFYGMYRDVAVINLTENYRSHGDVLHTAHNIARQIDTRLHHHFEGMSKLLVASRKNLPAARILRNEFLSDIAQNDWVATEIQKLIAKGTHPNEIAVLAPGHKYLTALVPYLNAKKIPVRYEKRENILETPVVRELITMSKLTLALAAHDEHTANALWPEVLSFEFWHVPISELWSISWQVTEYRTGSLTWSKALLDHPTLKSPALLFLGLAHRTETETCEAMLDFLIGTEAIQTNEPGNATVCSPLRTFYTGPGMQQKYPERFYDALSHLTVLRAKLREYQATQENALTLADLVNFIEMYEDAEQRMINSSPYNQQADAVQLMTVFKAKGLEFEHVFLPNFQDEVWGSSARGSNNKLTLPPNLVPIRHAGATEDEKLRVLFVAITRAKFGLYLSSCLQNYAGKATKRLKYIDEQEQPDGSFKALALPAAMQVVACADHNAPTLELLELDWRQRHIDGITAAELRALLSERLRNYQISPTHLNTFVDTEYGGPEKFFFTTLLRFPQAPTVDSQFGNSIHETMEWVQHMVNEQGSAPKTEATIKRFTAAMHAKRLADTQTALEIERGEKALAAYLAKNGTTFRPGDRAEYNFRNEGVFIGKAHMSGKIDRMEIDKATKTITVIDYKTGKSYAHKESNAKLHKYTQQLYCYKLLIENSHTFKGYKVAKGRLEFIEPDSDGRINALEFDLAGKDIERTMQLVQVVWQHIMQLDFPDISGYDPTLTGMKKLEADLLEENI